MRAPISRKAAPGFQEVDDFTDLELYAEYPATSAKVVRGRSAEYIFARERPIDMIPDI